MTLKKFMGMFSPSGMIEGATVIKKVIHGTLYCCDPNCGFTKEIVLVKHASGGNRAGVFIVHEYHCGECFGLMTMEVADDELRARQNKCDVEGTSDGSVQTG